jgi:hypothetical protein
LKPASKVFDALLSIAIFVFILLGCGSDENGQRPAGENQDQAQESMKEPSLQLVSQLQKEIAFQTDKHILKMLDENPGLLDVKLTSKRVGEVSVLAFSAVHRSNFETILPRLIERGADPSSAVEPVAHMGKWIVLDKLLKAGANPNAGDGLILAAANNHSQTVTKLLEAGADPNKPASYGGKMGEGEPTAIHLAAYWGNVDTLRALVEAGGNVNVTDGSNCPPLCDAIEKQQVSAILYLVEQGANVTMLPYKYEQDLGKLARERGLQDILRWIGWE